MSPPRKLQMVQGDGDAVCIDGVCALPEEPTTVDVEDDQARGERR